MKVVAVNGSARKNGNTACLIGAVFEALQKEGIETESIALAGQVIEPCKACWGCGKIGNCIHHEDLFQDLFLKMTEADGILLASPVYSGQYILRHAGCSGAGGGSVRYESRADEAQGGSGCGRCAAGRCPAGFGCHEPFFSLS